MDFLMCFLGALAGNLAYDIFVYFFGGDSNDNDDGAAV